MSITDSNVDYSSVIGFLSHLNTEELKGVLNDDERLDGILKDVKQGSDREIEKEMLMASNRSLAEYNLSKEPILLEYKKELIRFSEEGEELYRRVSEKYKNLMELSGQQKMDTKLAVLQMSAAEIEEESEKIAEAFLNGDSDVEDFLEQFMSRRKVMHLNKVRTDKMSEILRHRSNDIQQVGGNQWPHLAAVNGVPSGHLY